MAGEYNPEAVFQYRYFTVAENPQSNPRIVNDDNVYDVGRSEILSTSKRIFKDKTTQGRNRHSNKFPPKLLDHFSSPT